MANKIGDTVKAYGGSYRYKKNPDGSIGIDYFDGSGKPIANNEFQKLIEKSLKGSGQNVSTAGNFMPTTKGIVDQSTQTGSVLGASTGGEMFGPSYTPNPTANVFNSTPSIAAGAVANPNIKIYQGQTFDLNDPNQRLAYYQAVQTTLQAQKEAALAAADNAFKQNDTQSVQQYQQYISTIDQNLADLNASAKQYATDYGKTVNEFNASKNAGDVSRQNYFASISPNAFQSSQASSQQFANDKYNQGIADLATQANNAVGLDYINNPSSNVFDANSAYGRNVANITRQKTDLANNFDTYRTGALTGLKTGQDTINNNYNTALAGNAESLGAVDVQQGKNPFQYGVQTYTPSNVATPSVASYSPYVSFNQLADTTNPNSQYKAPSAGANAFSQPALDSFLNRTNPSLAGKSKNDWFTKYLQGKVTA